MYLPAGHKLKYVIKYAVYSTLKMKSTSFYHCHLVPFAFSQIHQEAYHRVNKGSHLMMGPGILLPLPVSIWFLHFLYRRAVHP